MKKETLLRKLQRKSDRFVINAREISSRGTSFLIAMLGVILQASHTTLLMFDVSAFKNFWIKLAVALGIGIFVSCALAIFTIKSDGKNREIKTIINTFFYFEVYSNVFYYVNKLIVSNISFLNGTIDFSKVTAQNYFYLLIALPFAYIVPFTIKKFAGIISADNKLQMGSIESEDDIIDSSKLEEFKKEIIEEVGETSTPQGILDQLAENKQMLETLREQSQNMELPEEINTEEVKKEIKQLGLDAANEIRKNLEQEFKEFDPKNYLKKGQTVTLKSGDKESRVLLS